MLVRAVSIPESAALFSDNGRNFLAIPESGVRFSADRSDKSLGGDIFMNILFIAMKKTLTTDRKAVYEKPEVKSFDLSMEQAILDASPEFNSFNPEEIW